MFWPRVAITTIVVAFATTGGRASAQSFDPAYRFRTFTTPHFSIHFHQDEQALAERLAVIAENAWLALGKALSVVPPRRTDVILVDQMEAANGWATPVPRNTMMVTAAWPSGAEFIGATDDWLRLVFTHEFTHIVHLDQSRGWATVVRSLFGRVPLAFPNTWLPTWQIEGLATFEESAIAGAGREHAGDFRAIVDEAARTNHLEPLDRVNGGLVAWPSGSAAYAYGLGFHDYLLTRFGQDRLAALVSATAGTLPYFWPRAFARVFGISMGSLWHDYQTSLIARFSSPEATAAKAAAAADQAVKLTSHGFNVTGPRIATSECRTCPAEVIYSVQTPDEFPRLYAVPLDASGPPVRLATRYGGDTTGATRLTLYLDQQERRRNAGLYSDLYAFDRERQTVRRLTRDLRLSDPDASPDGRTLVAVRARPGQRDLVLARINGSDRIGTGDLTVLASAADQQFNAPRFSPDGTMIAAERHRAGGYSEIVVINVATHAVRVIASAPRTRWVTPAWRPDGLAVVAAGAADDRVFNLFEIGLGDGATRPLTHTTGGATWPSVTPDGQFLVFVGYTPAGFDLFRVRYRPGPVMAETNGRLPGASRALGTAALPQPSVVRGTIASYSPWRTIAPTAWTPIVRTPSSGLQIGATVAGSDVLGYHVYELSASSFATQPTGTPRVHSPDLSAAYVYSRWTVQPWVGVSQTTTFFGAVPVAAGAPVTSTVREHRIEVGVALPTVGVRWSRAVTASFVHAVASIDERDTMDRLDRSAIRASIGAGNAHVYGYSVSPEGGFVAGATGEFVRSAFGASGNATVWTGDTRAYLPGVVRHHVLALRLAGGATLGDARAARVFLLGGAQSAPGPTSFGSEAFSLLRGFAPNAFAGTRIAAANADYRLPFWRPERGAGWWPIFLQTVHASAFADAGTVWTQQASASELKWDAGAEVSANVVLGYSLPLTLTAGAARGYDRSRDIGDGWRFYLRVGRAF